MFVMASYCGHIAEGFGSWSRFGFAASKRAFMQRQKDVKFFIFGGTHTISALTTNKILMA